MQFKCVRVEVWVSGRVQGVYYRESTCQVARELAVTGWVENLGDGRVHGVFEGEEAAVERLLEFAKVGPERAKVERVEVEKQEYRDEFRDFSVRRAPG